MTSIDTHEFKKLLETERARLLDAVDYLEKENASSLEDALGELGGRGENDHMADAAGSAYDREFDAGLEEGAQQTVEEIDAALKRIEDGSYGVCEVCGEPIGAERLSAIPWTRLCIDDKRRLS